MAVTLPGRERRRRPRAPSHAVLHGAAIVYLALFDVVPAEVWLPAAGMLACAHTGRLFAGLWQRSQ